VIDEDEVRAEVGVRIEMRMEPETKLRIEVRTMVELILSIYLVEINNYLIRRKEKETEQ
jgi:hypothetical protein